MKMQNGERPFGAGTAVLTPRIWRLQNRALEKDIIPEAVKVEYDEADLELAEPIRIGKRLKEYLLAQPVVIREDEELVGWTVFDGSVEANLYSRTGHKAFWGAFQKYYIKPQEKLGIFEWQHTCADFPKVLKIGLEGLRKEIEGARQKWEGDKARLDYLKGLELALEGIRGRARKCAAACREAAEREKDGVRKAVLEEMAARCEWVPIHGARTFREGVQSVYFCFDFLPDAIGRLDQYLKGLYFADLAAGRITREEARDYLQELFIFIDAHTPHGSPNYDKGGECHMTVGGLNRDGSDGWTDFSKLVVEAAMGCDLKRPQMSFRWHEGTAREVLKFMLDCERRDPNMRIAFDGDVVRVPTLARRLGISIEQARDYCITGCNEPTFMGGISFGGFHINALRCMERVFTVRKGEVRTARTWEEFAAIFVEELEHDLGEALEMAGKFNALRAGDCNVLSALFLEGCIERAESPTRGGAARECPVMDLLGTPNVIDSLCVVKQFVYDEKRCGMEEIIAALDDDWKGHEKLWREIRHDGKFYGHNDAFSNEVAQFYHRAVAKFAAGKKDYFGSPLLYGNHTGYNDNATKFGALTRATPDGRHAGEYLSFGSGPMNGHAPDGATSILLAAAKMDPEGIMCGTSILNLSLPELTITNEAVFEKLVAMVEVYFREGGLHLQMNHVSRETLIDAQKHPENYLNLRVRVSGFSGCFVQLKKTIQDEIIERLTVQR